MKIMATVSLKPGMFIGEDIHNYKKELLIPAKTMLDNDLIKKLNRHSVVCASVMEQEDFAATHYEKITLTQGFKTFKTTYEENFIRYKAIMITFITNNIPIDLNQLLEIHSAITSCVKNKELILDYLYTMLPSEDDLTHAHCMNSAIIAGVFARWLKLSEEETNILVQSAFLYDIGKLKLPDKLIWKPGKLTDLEFEQIKTHTLIGFQLLENMQINPHIINSVLMHHERSDGSGYPSRLRGHKIDRFAKYIAIIDSYEAMTSPRMYRSSLHPFQVISNFEKAGFLIYEEAILRPVLARIAASQVGNKARLSDGRTAEIIVVNEHKLSRPLLRDEKGALVDLSTEPALMIDCII